MQKIAVIDYGMGNLFSIQKKIVKLGAEPIITSDYNQINAADKIILPGVGHFGNAILNLKTLNLMEVLHENVILKKKPILGICLGMQLMTKYSEEGDVPGLNWIDAQVLKFQINDSTKNKVPHTGWNGIFKKKESKILNNIENDSEFYFVHSYYVKCNDNNDILTETKHEVDFTSSFEKDNIFGVQFHPEKSHKTGDLLMNNFLNL